MNPKYLDKDIYERAKRKVDTMYKTHSAYKSAQLLKTYKDMGGRVDESKSKGGLRTWFRQRWVNLSPYAEGLTKSKTEFKCGEKHPKQKGPSVCRPKKDVGKYTKEQIKKAVAKKKKGQTIDWSEL